MNDEETTAEIPAAERWVAELTEQLAQVRRIAQRWAAASTDLSRSAAIDRAKNQSTGRGFLGGLLGTRYRSLVRAGGASSNAKIATHVAAKRAEIVAGKRAAQDAVRMVQTELSTAKQRLKSLSSRRGARGGRASVAVAAHGSLDMLQKLKEAHTAGLLTEQEYEEKRKKLVSQI